MGGGGGGARRHTIGVAVVDKTGKWQKPTNGNREAAPISLCTPTENQTTVFYAAAET